jgi:predicted permease
MTDIIIRAGYFVAIILLGFTLRKIGLFKKEDFSVLSKVVLKITFPAAVVTSFAGRQIDPSMFILIGIAILCAALHMVIAVLVNLRRSPGQKAFYLLNLTGCNIGNFTMPFVQSFMGPIGVIATGIYDTGNALMVLGTNMGVASSIKSGSGFSFKRIGKALLASVPFLTYFTMLLLSVIGVRLPAVITDLADVIGSANPFLAMFMIGVGFEIGAEKGHIAKIVRFMLLRYCIAAVFALVFWFALPFALEVRQALVIVAFSPIPNIVPAYTEELGEDVGLSSAINSVAIICSIVIDVILLSFIL